MKWIQKRPRKDSSSHAEDALWIATIRAGKDRSQVQQAYQGLMRKYWEVVMVLSVGKLGDAQEAADVSQEAFLRSFQSLEQLNHPTAFLGWLLRIARNLTTDHLRARKSTVSLDALGDAVEGVTLSATVPHFQADLEKKEEIESVLIAVNCLPDRYREVITLKYLKDMDGRTMAEHLGEPEGTVRNRLFRALTKHRETLEPQPRS